jgi:hypothetical protein
MKNPIHANEFGGDPFPVQVPGLREPAKGPGKGTEEEDAEGEDPKDYDLGGSD